MENRAEILRGMKICRFCLETKTTLRSIYEHEGNSSSETKSVPLPLQIMACVGIEVFANDGMPQLICDHCRMQALKSYLFKANCKEADDALKLFIATGTLVKPHLKRAIDVIPVSDIRQKRPPEKIVPSKNKRIKIEENTGELITLNFSNAIEVTEVQNCEYQSIAQGHEEVVITRATEDEEDDEYDEEQATEGEEMEIDSRINPTLKVRQVQTDCFPCDQCERSFPLKQLLDLHKVNHERERLFECEECNKKFFTKYDLFKHVKSHTGAKPFNCVVCNKSFSRESLLHRHEKIHVDVPKYLCSQCDRTFLTREDLDLHAEKHKKDRPYTCVICQKGFVFKQGLERHLQTHSNDKPHKCNYCEASFNSTIKLTRHITSHAGLRPYPCKLCGRTFLLSHHLTRHMRSHYAAKGYLDAAINQYKCDICSMSFKKKDSLINHTAIHSMVNLKCVICNTSFDDATSVKQHINTHLSGLPYPCDRCDYSFETQEQLEEHEVKHAEMEYEEQIEKEVVEEAKQQAELGGPNEDQEMHDEQEEQLEEEEEDEVTEFTITNDVNNPEVVRRSTRQVKVKTYPDFLKDEILSENEEEQENYTVETTEIQSPIPQDQYTIKPIVRSEGTKVYTRKSTNALKYKPPEIPVQPSIAKDQGPITIDNITLTNQELEALPTKKFIDMKIGGKTVRVQKLLVTKNEMLAMAREGKIEFSGKTFVFKKPGLATVLNSPNSPAIMEKDFTHQSHQQRKVYERKHVSNNETHQESRNEHDEATEVHTLDNVPMVPVEEVSISLE